MTKKKSDQFSDFTHALNDVLKVSHTEMKELLEKDKANKKATRKTKPVASDRERHGEDSLVTVIGSCWPSHE